MPKGPGLNPQYNNVTHNTKYNRRKAPKKHPGVRELLLTMLALSSKRSLDQTLGWNEGKAQKAIAQKQMIY
jgi:hypothetical protein